MIGSRQNDRPDKNPPILSMRHDRILRGRQVSALCENPGFIPLGGLLPAIIRVGGRYQPLRENPGFIPLGGFLPAIIRVGDWCQPCVRTQVLSRLAGFCLP